MRSFGVLVSAACFLVTTFGLRGAAPDALPGGVYEVRGVVAAVPLPPRPGAIARGDAYLLNPNGTVDRIYGGSAAPGRWNYRKVTSNIAVLTLEWSGVSVPHNLGFTTDTEGSWSTVGSTAITNTFTLLPAAGRSKIVNASALFFVRSGGTASMGFVVGEPGAMVLVRAVGPGLAQFGVSGALASQTLSILDSRATVVASNEQWTRESRAQQPGISARVTDSSRLVGAFPLSPDSADSAILALLRPGSYIAHVRPVDPAATGEVLIEVYGLP